MKKHFLLAACLIFSAVFAQSQTQSGQPAPKTTTGTQSQPAQPATGQAPTQSGAIDGSSGQVVTEQVIPNAPAPVPFGGTNQVTFGTTNPPFARTNLPFAATNQPALRGTNSRPLFGANKGVINEASGASTNAAGLTNAVEQAFTQQLRAALARPGATQIFFPQTGSKITVMNQNGVVTLQGFVTNEGERRSIEERIKNTPGVTSVNNQLQIGEGRSRGINPLLNPTPDAGSETNRQLLNP